MHLFSLLVQKSLNHTVYCERISALQSSFGQWSRLIRAYSEFGSRRLVTCVSDVTLDCKTHSNNDILQTDQQLEYITVPRNPNGRT